MKTLFAGIFAFCCLATFAQNNTGLAVVDCSELHEKKGLQLLNEQPYTGLCQSQHANGNVANESHYVKGLVHGQQNTYFENGDLQKSASYKQGVLQGPVRHYFESGKLAESGQVAVGLKTGTWKSYYPTGLLKAEEHYLDGKKTGLTKVYAKNGKLESKGRFVSGLQEGKWTTYNTQSGKVDEVIQYKNGKPINK